MSKLPLLWQYSPAPKTLLPSEMPQPTPFNKRLSRITIYLTSGVSIVIILWLLQHFSSEIQGFSFSELSPDAVFACILIFIAALIGIFMSAVIICLPVLLFLSYKFYSEDMKSIKLNTAEIKRYQQKKYALSADKFYIFLPTLQPNHEESAEEEKFVVGESLDMEKIDAVRLLPEGLAIYSGSSTPVFSLDLPQNEAIELKKKLLELRPDGLLDADKF
jgi:hypothetical protein